MDLKTLDSNKIRIVEVISKGLQLCFSNTAYQYDDQTILYKNEEDMIWIYHLELVRHTTESFNPKWKRVLPTKVVSEIIIRSWPDKKILEEHKFNL